MNSREDGGAGGALGYPVPVLVLWAAAGTVAMMLDSASSPVGHERSQFGLSVLMVTFGVWAFWRSGGAQVTAAGIYCLSAAAFVGFAGLWWWNRNLPVDDATFIATATGYWTTLAMYAVFWVREPSRQPWPRPNPQVTAWGMRIGVIATLLVVAAGTAEFGSLGQFTIGGLSLFLVSAMLHRASGGQLPLRFVLVVVALAIYWQVAFDGFGRLNVASLAFVGAIVGSGLSPRRLVKIGVLAGTIPVATYFVNVRNQIGAGDGLGSVVNPLHSFGQLVAAHGTGRFDHALGETFVTTILFWVPRSLWSAKPDGFGRELTALLEPQLLSTNHSMAALSYGEWFFNFGWLGVVAMVAVLGLLIRGLDRWLGRVTSGELMTRRQFVGAVLCVLLVSNIANLMWVGSFTYFARAGQQIMLVLAVAAWTASRSARDDSPTSPPKVDRTAAPSIQRGADASL